jgi:hypothetical protein
MRSVHILAQTEAQVVMEQPIGLFLGELIIFSIAVLYPYITLEYTFPFGIVMGGPIEQLQLQRKSPVYSLYHADVTSKLFKMS